MIKKGSSFINVQITGRWLKTPEANNLVFFRMNWQSFRAGQYGLARANPLRARHAIYVTGVGAGCIPHWVRHVILSDNADDLPHWGRDHFACYGDRLGLLQPTSVGMVGTSLR